MTTWRERARTAAVLTAASATAATVRRALPHRSRTSRLWRPQALSPPLPRRAECASLSALARSRLSLRHSTIPLCRWTRATSVTTGRHPATPLAQTVTTDWPGPAAVAHHTAAPSRLRSCRHPSRPFPSLERVGLHSGVSSAGRVSVTAARVQPLARVGRYRPLSARPPCLLGARQRGHAAAVTVPSGTTLRRRSL
jgi:hypothetical protein